MSKTPSTIDESIRTNDELYYYWYYWLKDPNVFSSERAMKLMEFLERNYGESHARSLKVDVINLERTEEELIILIFEIPENYYGIDINKIEQKTIESSSRREYKPTTSRTPKQIARYFVNPLWNPDYSRKSTMEHAHTVIPRPELEHLTEFVEALKRVKYQEDEIFSSIKNLPKWAKQIVEILQKSDGIKNDNLMRRLRKNGLPESYKHISELFKEEYAKAFYRENITSDSAYYKLKGTDFTP